MTRKGSGEWFLGSVEYDAKVSFARLHPIAKISADGTAWETITALKTRFPTVGSVSWFKAPAGTRKHAIFEFQAVPNPKFNPTKGPDELMVHDARLAIEILECEGYTEHRLRESLMGEGVPISPPPVCRSLLKLSADRWVGPLDLVERKSGYWVLPAETEREAIPMHRAQPTPASAVRTGGGQRVMLVTAGSPVTVKHLVNWQSDEDVLRGVLRRLHRLDVDRFKKLDLSYKAFEAYIDAVAGAELMPDQQLTREQARVERVKELQKALPLAAQLVEELVIALESSGALKHRIVERIDALALERKAEINAQLTVERAELKKMHDQVERGRTEIAELAEQIDLRKKALSADLVAADEAMQGKVRQIREAPVKAVAEILAASALLPALVQWPKDGSHRQPVLGAAPESDSTTVNDPKALLKTLSDEFVRSGVALHSLFALSAAFVAGLVPICGGDAASEAVRAFGRCLCGGNAWWLPVSPITISLNDVLAPTGQSHQPVVAGLRDIIDAAGKRSDALALGILEGIDVAPAECFLLPLIKLAETGASARVLDVPLLAADGSHIRKWPCNLVLALTIAGTSTSLPLPRRVWEFAPLFNLGWSDITAAPAPTAGTLTRISVGNWLEIRAAAERVEPPSEVVLHKLSPPARGLAARFYGAAIALGAEPQDATQMTATHILAPALATANAALPAGFPEVATRHFEIAKALVSQSPNDT